MALRKDLDGLRMQKPGNDRLYLMDAGQRRWVPDMDTYGELFRDLNNIVEDTEIDNIDQGEPISKGALLARAAGEPEVYLIDQGHKRWIKSMATMDRYNFSWDKVKVVAPNIIASIPTGAPIGWPE